MEEEAIGDWGCHIYIPIQWNGSLERICNATLAHFKTETMPTSFNPSDFSKMTSLHISLSRYFALRKHQITPFLGKLTKALNDFVGPLQVAIFGDYHVLTNDDGSRVFVGMGIEDRMGKLHDLLERCNKTLRAFDLPAYHEEALMHISIASAEIPNHDETNDTKEEVNDPRKHTSSSTLKISPDNITLKRLGFLVECVEAAENLSEYVPVSQIDSQTDPPSSQLAMNLEAKAVHCSVGSGYEIYGNTIPYHEQTHIYAHTFIHTHTCPATDLSSLTKFCFTVPLLVTLLHDQFQSIGCPVRREQDNSRKFIPAR